MILELDHGTVAAVAVSDEIDDARAVRVPDHAAVTLADALARLHPDEQALAATLATVRRRDWVAGRLALRAALDRTVASSAAPILADDRGAPILPTGAVGSVSHKRGLAVALATSGVDHRVGVDVELAAGSRLDLGPRVLTDPERAALAHLDPAARARAVILRFALKEAIYKAIDPFVRRYVGFRELTVWPSSGRATVEPHASDLHLHIEAAWLEVGEVVIATARAHR